MLWMLAIPLSAENNYFFKILDARNGLTSSQINCIIKDKKGFMWFGTPAGLYRYDGYEFKHFQSDSQDASSLLDSYIINIQETKDRNLWIETPTGFCIYHPQTETFERDMRQVLANINVTAVPKISYIDRHDNLWLYIPTIGVICYNMQQQMLYEFTFLGGSKGNFSIPQGEICSIGECKEGAILVYNDGTLVCCDVMHQQNVVWTTDEIAKKGLRKTNTLKVFADQMNNIWLYGQGTLLIYNKKTNSWNTTLGESIGLTGIGVDHGVNGMAGDRNGNIWIATNRRGLLKANVNTQMLEEVMISTMIPSRIQNSPSIQSVYVDDTDLLWVGTSKSGIAYWGANIYKFNQNMLGDITAIAEDANGNMVYGTGDNGILNSNIPLASLKVTCMTYTIDGSLWVGSEQNGLTRIKDGETTYYSQHRDDPRRTLIDDHVNALCTDKAGNLWIATDNGLQMFNIRMETFSNYTKENGKLKVNNVTSLFHTKKNELLIGTSEGLTIMNVSNSEVEHLVGNSTAVEKFTNAYITYVFKDSRGLIWVGTREGINILNTEIDDLDIINEKDGLCNNNICAIAEDKSKNIWVTTSNGVTRIVAQRNHEDGTFDYGIYNYTINDGLQSNEFNPGSILTKKDGMVMMGGLYGVNWTRQQSADETAALPSVMLTQLLIGEEEIKTGHIYNDYVPLPQALNESTSIELINDHNTFTIKFAAGNYNQSERLLFEYWMEGLDKSWRNGNALNHSVTFTNLKSGKYTLHVKAISVDSAISQQERIIEIKIDAPWYLQLWMLIFYAVVIIIVVYLWRMGIAQIKNHWKKKKAMLEELANQKEEIKAASEDLRQPMARMTTIIMNLTELNTTLEGREQLNNLHSQMLQVITRVSDMQSALEHPEENAKKQVNKHFELDSHGEMNLPDVIGQELTSEIKSQLRDSPTSKLRLMFIDDSDEFIRFVDARLHYIYDFHSYNNITSAAADIESTLPDLIICKQNMEPMTGSELCNKVKSNPRFDKIKFVLVTDGKLSTQEMTDQNITMAADDYLSKPFNLQEVAVRFNKLLGISNVMITNDLIEGAETRLLEGRNSSMTTATESISSGEYNAIDVDDPNDEIHNVDIHFIKEEKAQQKEETIEDEEFAGYTMSDAMDRQLIKNIEQYVQQNMSRGQIDLEEMAQAMGMGMRPLFLKVRDITGKTPAEVVRDMRLKNACILLKRTNINMNELANNIGIATGDSFINIFKEKFGMSPSEYRLKYRK